MTTIDADDARAGRWLVLVLLVLHAIGRLDFRFLVSNLLPVRAQASTARLLLQTA